MRMSSRPVRWSGPLLGLILGTVGCSQLSAGDMASPTAPSSSLGRSGLAADSSVSSPMVGPPTITYDATGSWHEIVTARGVILEETDTDLEQDTNGIITHCGECEGELWTFTPIGVTPGRIVYSVTAGGDGEPCDFDVSGTAQLNVATDTITGQITGTSDDCSRGTASVVLTRNN